ncbi:MAG: hypothetical protein KF718_32205 [Polyangiaceae bacterium]|nr:hypothetical protein [Polyangiaceae bacterium]
MLSEQPVELFDLGLDPSPGRRGEEIGLRRLQARDVGAQGFHLLFSLGESIGERRGSAAGGDELDKVVNPGFRPVELHLLQTQFLRNVLELLLHLLRGALVDQVKDLGIEHCFIESCDELRLQPLAGDQLAVVAGPSRSVQATVVPAGLAAHQGNRAATGTTLQRP